MKSATFCKRLSYCLVFVSFFNLSLSATNDEIKQLQDEYKSNERQMELLRSQIDLFKDLQPELNNIKVQYAPSFLGNPIIISATESEVAAYITQSYLNDVIYNGKEFNFEELKNSIQSVLESSRIVKNEITSRMEAFENQYEKLASRNRWIKDRIEFLTDQMTNSQNTGYSFANNDFWLGTWSVTSKHTGGAHKGASVTSQLTILKEAGEYFIRFSSSKVKIMQISPSELTYRVQAGGNDVTTRFVPVGDNEIKGDFMGRYLQTNQSVEGEYKGIRFRK